MVEAPVTGAAVGGLVDAVVELVEAAVVVLDDFFLPPPVPVITARAMARPTTMTIIGMVRVLRRRRRWAS
jgi:hypothetical protein